MLFSRLLGSQQLTEGTHMDIEQLSPPPWGTPMAQMDAWLAAELTQRGLEADQTITTMLKVIVKSHLLAELEEAQSAIHAYGHITPFPGAVRKKLAEGVGHPYPVDSLEHVLLLGEFDRGREHRTWRDVIAGVLQPKSWWAPSVTKADK